MIFPSGVFHIDPGPTVSRATEDPNGCRITDKPLHFIPEVLALRSLQDEVARSAGMGERGTGEKYGTILRCSRDMTKE